MPVLLAFALAASSAAPSPVPPPTAPRAVAAICVSVASGPGTGSTASFGAGLSADEGDDEAAVIAGIAKRGLYETVVTEAQKYLQRFASHRQAPAVRYRLADALFELGRLADALVEYRRLDGIANFEQAVEVDFRIGQCALETGDAAAAAAAFASALKGAAENESADYLRVPATYLLGEALFRAERFDEAAKAYGAVLQLKGGANDYARDARYGATWSAFKAGQHDAVVAAATAFLAAHEGDPQAGEIAFLAAESHVAAGRPADALQWYGRVREGRYVESALRGAAFAEVERGDAAAAARRFATLLERFPRGEFASEAALQRGVQLVRAKEFRAAVDAFAAEAVAADAQSAYWRAVACAGIDDHAASYAAAKEGLDRSPDPALAAQLRIAAGDALFELGRADEAARLYESSGSAYALHAAAVARLNAGDAAEAARLAATLLAGAAREPGAEYRGEALLTRAEALFRLERHAEAEPVLRQLLAEVTPGEGGAAPAAATSLPAAEIARATSRLAWCRWFADDGAEAARLFDSVAANAEARPAERAEATFMAGRAALASGDEARGRARFAGYLAAAPDGPFAAEALLRLARLTPGAAGLQHYDRIATDFGASDLVAAALSESAERRVALGDTEGAAAGYAALVTRFPNDPLAMNARYGLAWARYQGGDFEGASEPLWTVARAEGADGELRAAALELLVWVEAGAQRPERVVEALRGLTARVDGSERILRAARAADAALVEAGDKERRKAIWDTVAAKLQGPELSAARVELGFVALDRGDAAEAARMAIAAGELAPESADVAELYFFVGEAYFDAGDDERAAPLYVAASEHGRPEVAERALYKAGFAELRRGKDADALKAFSALVERFPRGVLFPESLYLAGEASFRQRKYDDAAGWLRRMTKEFPAHESRAKALFRLGVAEGELERWDASSVALAELIAKHQDFPSVVEAELWRGRALARLEQRRGARQSLARVVDQDEGILAAQARIELGRLSEAENDPESAVAEYLKVAVLYGHAEECAEALVRAGDVLGRTGKPERAKGCYREVLTDYPKTEWAKEAQKRLE